MTYTPLQGEQFVERVLGRVSLQTMLLLNSGGWRADRVFRTCLERMNGLGNARRASGPTPSDVPEYKDFTRAVQLLQRLRSDDRAHVATRTEGDRTAFVLRFDAGARNSSDYGELMRLLDVDPSLGEYKLVANTRQTGRDTVNLQTRSFIGVMYFLSQAVQVPAPDVEAGRVTVTTDAAGAPV